MGVIQSLRSQATAVRAQEDTKLQVSGYLGNVNKSLGSQVDQLIDGLQGAINERTKAYNGIVSKLTQQVSGKGAIGDQGVQFAFQLVKSTISTASSIAMAAGAAQNNASAGKESSLETSIYATETSIVSVYSSPPIYDFITPGAYLAAASVSACITSMKNANTNAGNIAGAAKIAADILDITTNLIGLITTVMQGATISKTIESLTYDYRRMASQLGMTDQGTDDGLLDQGASKLLNMRDSLMVRYKATEGSSGPANSRGYVGTLRRRV